jgi:hypothetical protein
LKSMFTNETIRCVFPAKQLVPPVESSKASLRKC